MQREELSALPKNLTWSNAHLKFVIVVLLPHSKPVTWTKMLGNSKEKWLRDFYSIFLTTQMSLTKIF